MLTFIFSLQNFFAHLCIAIVLKRPIAPFITGRDEVTAKAKSIAHYCLTVFIQDCKELVSTAVSKELEEQLQSTPDLAPHISRRKKALAQWKKSDTPLAWHDHDKPDTATYNNLVLALAQDPDALNEGLLPSSDSWTYFLLAKHFMHVATFPARLSAPFSRKGFFINILPLALKELKHLVCTKESDSDSNICATLAYMMNKMKIHYVPWHRPPVENQRGSAPRAVSHRHWMFLIRTTGKGEQVIPKPTGTMEKVKEIGRTAAMLDKSAPWSVPGQLEEMGPMWKKVVLPHEWQIKNASLGRVENLTDGKYVADTYRWVESTYNGELWKHHMGLVWAILYSAILPNIFCDKKLKDSIVNIKNELKLTQEIRRFPWIQTTCEMLKGITAREPYITMLSTMIIALLDNGSPLQEYLNDHKNAFGENWTSKHGMYISITYR